MQNSRSIGQRIGQAIFLLLIIVLLTGTLGQLFANRVGESLSTVNTNMEHMDSISSVTRGWTNMRNMMDVVLLRQDPVLGVHSLEADLQAFLAGLEAIGSTAGSVRQETLDNVQAQGQELVAISENIVEAARMGDWSTAQALRVNELSPRQHAFEQQLDLLARNIEAAVDRALADADQRQRAMFNYWLVAATLAIVVGVVIGYLTTRSISQPLGQLVEQVERITRRDLTPQEPLQRQDEIGQLSRALSLMTDWLRESYGELEERVAERTRALETIAQISRNLSTILDPTQLLEEMVSQVQTAFNYYHTQVYLLDAQGKHLRLTAATGMAGQRLLEKGHQLPAGEGLVGQAAAQNKPALIPNVALNRDWLANPELPQTHAELAVPIAFGTQVLGVLDVQHSTAGGLDEQDLTLMQSMANQVAIALQNARLFEQVNRRVAREAQINEIGQQIQQATSVDAVLQVAVEQLGKTLGSRRATVLLSRSLANGNGKQ